MTDFEKLYLLMFLFAAVVVTVNFQNCYHTTDL